MEQINQHSKVNQGDIVMIKFWHLDNLTNSIVQRFGILRDDYDNKNSLSCCMDKMITLYNISGIVKEDKVHRVFCWSEKGFKLLGGVRGMDFGTRNDKVDIFKLNEEEAKKLQAYITKVKIVEQLIK